MGLNFRVGLPGPFSYSKRVGGGGNKGSGGTGCGLFLLIFVAVLPAATMGPFSLFIYVPVGIFLLLALIGHVLQKREAKRKE